MKKVKLPKKVIIQDPKEITVNFRELGKHSKPKHDKRDAFKVQNKKLFYGLAGVRNI